MGRPTHVLVVAAEPDRRDSTRSLQEACAALARRPDVDVDVWFLRDGEVPPWWPGAQVVDHLRSEGPAVARALDRTGPSRLAGAARGRVLRRWWRSAAPDVVVLDDGLGGRVLPTDAGVVRVVRRNPAPPAGAALEPTAATRADLVLAPAPEAAGGPPWVRTGDLVDLDAAVAARRRARPQVRAEHDVPDGTDLLVGWGVDEWLDAPDVFVRTLWFLQDRHGSGAHGLWLDDGDDASVADLVRAEAARCGLADRVHVSRGADASWRLAGDAALLPYRAPADRREVLEAVAAGLAVVTSAPDPVDDPAVSAVAPLDLEAAAAATALALAGDTERRVEAARERIDASTWADRFLAAVEAAR
ncbi:hypothetical protein PO878_15300 [Iamia majanohamensis]|uniref:Glycosyltransferase n=1 Tax=Iamia majanohamensis TaxID=467976 RepID=A0AAE9Y7J1_9ACTN|nr:hypothetical protein [Iamia majanohamensis]WCO65868.1 hypothetical protein PO878_15300 [Iamia majanohamensis]